MNTLRTILTMSLLMVCAALNTTAQSNGTPKPITVEENNCESNKAWFDYIAVNSKEANTIIIIARLGNGEKSRMYNRRRLHNISTYLNYIRDLPKEKIVIAEGKKVSGRGRVDVYVNGKPFIVFTLGRNQDLAGGDCEQAANSLYYPLRRKAQ
jgi:hypothetical protein